MNRINILDFKQDFPDNEACLEWLKNQIYPDGIKCHACNRVTRHTRVSKRTCYKCNFCGHQVYPTAGTIFQKSTTPLKTWFSVIYWMSEAKGFLSAKDIQREFGVTYKTAWRLFHTIKLSFRNNNSEIEIQSNKPVQSASENQTEFKDYLGIKGIGNDSGKKHLVSDDHLKGDRTSRLIRLQMLLCQYPQGLRIEEIASKCSVSKRTIYRDLRALESELHIPIWEEGTRRGITEGYFFPPINFNREEAVNILLAIRTMQSSNYMHIPSLASTFMKLNIIVPNPLKKQIRDILDYMETLPINEKRVNNFNTLVKAWFSQHKVRITYRYLDEEKPLERIIEPYCIEPSLPAIGGSSYVIAFCNLKKTICAFKIAQIVGDIIIEPDTFELPSDFNPVDYLKAGWGVFSDDQEIETVILHVKPKICGLFRENPIHSSQSIQMQSDGSAIATLKVRDSINFRNWIIGWGDQMEVLAPQKLRNQIYDLAKSLVNIYSYKDI